MTDLLCVACRWTVIGEERNQPAITIMAGYAVCADHMGDFIDSRFSNYLAHVRRNNSRTT